jgi:hypothetical protein
MYKVLLGFLLGVLLMILLQKVTSGYEVSNLFAAASTTEGVQKIYDDEITRLTNQVNTNLGDATPESVQKAGEELRSNIAELSAQATKAFSRVASVPAVSSSPGPAPEAPAPEVMMAPEAPAPEVMMAPEVSTFEPEPYY